MSSEEGSSISGLGRKLDSNDAHELTAVLRFSIKGVFALSMFMRVYSESSSSPIILREGSIEEIWLMYIYCVMRSAFVTGSFLCFSYI